MDLDRGMDAARRRAADHQRQVEALAFHLGGDMAHFIKRRRDQAGQADDVGLLGLGDFENLRRRHHDAEIDDFVIVALEHDADDVLADVMDVALDGGHHDLAVIRAFGGAAGGEAFGLLFVHERHQVGNRLLHDARGFHHLRQEHLAGAEQVADDIHAVHQRAFDDVERTRQLLARFLGVGIDEFGDAVHQRVRQPAFDRLVAPGQIDGLGFLAFAAEFIGQRQQPLGGVGPLVEDHVLAGLAQFRIEVVIDRHLAGIDDAHVHAGGDGVIQEHRMHRLAHRARCRGTRTTGSTRRPRYGRAAGSCGSSASPR